MSGLPSGRSGGEERHRTRSQRHCGAQGGYGCWVRLLQANKEAGEKGLVWTEENLFKYLESPAAFMPENKMLFAGVKTEADRRDLIAYLKQQSE
jgi:cytochrome c